MFFCKLNLSVNFIFPKHNPNLFLLFCYKTPSMYFAKCNSNMNRKDYNQVQSTQASENLKKIIYKRTSQSISNRGSVTVEAALVMPFFFFVLYALLLVNQMLLTEDRIHEALVETGRVLAGEATEDITTVRAQMELKSRVRSSKLTLVSGGVAGISLWASRLPNDQQEIELHASYCMKLSIPFLFTFTVPVQAVVTQRIFDGCHTGAGTKAGTGSVVYVAEYESVYHTNPQCSHIAIRLVPASDTSLLAGKRQCKSCKNYHQEGSFVTLAGDCIHQNSQCSRIKRTVYMVDKNKTGGLPLCSRCAGKK